MAIYDLFEPEKMEDFTETFDQIDPPVENGGKAHLFSTFVTRFCFLLLLLADLAWFALNVALLTLVFACFLVTAGKVNFFRNRLKRFWLHFRRSCVCALALFVGLFSPPFGIMVACTYFLMYDKAGMEEVVPATLQAQFKDVFKT